MIRRIVSFSLAQPLFVLLGTILLIVAGALAFQNLPVEAFPDVSDTQVNVIALYPGRAAEEVERQVTIPIETALSSVPNVVRAFSHTQFGLSFIILTFNDKPNDQTVRQQVLERLRGIDLPPGVEPDMAPLSTAIGEIFRFRLRGDHLTSQELRTLQDWVVEKQLRLVQGVADVVTMGGTMKQYEVAPDLGKLRDYKITLAQLFTALTRANANAGGGGVTQGRQQFLVRSLGAFRSSADIGTVVVAENKGTPILVKDIATVTVGSAPPQGLAGQDDADDIVNGIVIMRKGENPSRVLEALKEKIAYVNKTVLPKGVAIVPYYDRSWLIAKTLTTVFSNLTEGAMLVLIVLYAFLGNIRAALIVAAVIPLALLTTFLGLTAVGIPANLLSLGAMDFGIIVDGAVIVVENIVRRLGELKPEAARNPMRRFSTVREAVSEVGRPTFFSMIIIIAAHIPIFTLQRHEGRIFSPMAWTVTSALVGSLAVSLTLVPLLCLKWLKKVEHGDNRLVEWLKARYEPLLRRALARPKAVVLIAVAALAASLALGSRIGSEFLPELNEGSIWVNLTLPPSVSPAEAQEQVRLARQALHTVPEVKTVISKVGRPDDGTDPKIFNSAEFYVELAPEGTWRRGKDKDDLIKEMDAAVSEIPGMEPSFSQPIRDNVLESISQVDGQIVIKVRGDDLDRINASAKRILEHIATVPGVVRAFIDREGALPQYLIDIDRSGAARYGVNVGDVQDLVETAIAGKATSELWEGEKHFSVVVRLKAADRALPNLPDLLVATPGGAQVPLSQVAHFRSVMGAMNIARENGRRVLSIGVFIRDRDMGSVVADMKARVEADPAVLGEGDEIGWSGEFENQERAMKRLAWIVPLSIALIFLLLFDAFKSLKSALLIILNIPLAMIGGIVALAVTGIPLSVSAAIGFIALFGQAVLNGVVMVTYFNQLREEELTTEEAVIKGSLVRLRTVIMTALLAMFGLLPMALSHAIGSETQRPLAVVVIGGLISATFLTLFVLPTLYRLFYAERRDAAATRTPGGAAP